MNINLYPFNEVDVRLNDAGRVDYGICRGYRVYPYHRAKGKWLCGRYIYSNEWWNCSGDFTLKQIKEMVSRGTVMFH